MTTEPSKWNVAPGVNADCNDIPDTADADSGLASWSALFPQLTALPLSAGGARTHSVAIAAAGAHTHAITIGKTGSGAAFSILPPYIAAYMWRRTA